MPTLLVLMRHHVPEEVISVITAKFGEIEIVHDTAPFASVDDIIGRMASFGPLNDVKLLLVAPLHIFKGLCDRGIYPLRVRMEAFGEVPPEGVDRRYQFVEIERVLRIDTEPL